MFSFIWSIIQLLFVLIMNQATQAAVQHINCASNSSQSQPQSTCVLLPDECKNGDVTKCRYIAKFTPMMNANPISVRIELETKVDDQPKGQYIAMGLSNDDEMGGDSVMACVLPANSNKPAVGLSYNSGNTNEPLQNQNAVHLIDSGVLDGNIICVFDRYATVSDEKMFPIANASYFLLFARGMPISNGSTVLMPHPPNMHDPNFPMVSHGKIVFMGNKGAKIFGSVSIHFFAFFALILLMQ